ncbi:MAG TPA: hypothetical protein VFN10_13195 [Thermoanaerobaculia bacterium]|nr:hypothetical protein [Thermoanaerobaculia bacterium]
MPHTDLLEEETTFSHVASRPTDETGSPDFQMFDRFLNVLTLYRGVIFVSLIAVICAFILGATVYVLNTPRQMTTTLPFRLDFEGAESGSYPNGIPFSQSEIIDSGTLRTTYDQNRLDRFVPFGEFSHSVSVLASNATLDALQREYQAKLSEPRLTAVERDRIETEFRQKREGLNKNDYALILTTPSNLRHLPTTLAAKALQDTLTNWADHAIRTRRVLQYDVPVLSENVLRMDGDPNIDLITSLLMLRARTVELRRNITALRTLPGAELIRANNTSLPELDLNLTYLQKTLVEPLIATAVHDGVTQDKATTVSRLEAQLAWDRRALATAEDRVTVLRGALNDYVRDSSSETARALGTSQQSNDSTKSSGQNNPTEIVPQLSDTFLDRLVKMANDESDRHYRQKYVDEIRSASLDVGPLRAAVAYSEDLLNQVKAAPAAPSAEKIAHYRAEMDRLQNEFRRTISDINTIHRLLSRGLSPTRNLFTQTGAPSTTIDSGISAGRLVLVGVAVTLIALPLIIAAALMHWFVTTRRRTA